MAYLNSVDEVRSIEWHRSYLWDITFPQAPSPFNRWFPATDVEEDIFDLKTYSFEGGLSSYEVPQGTSQIGVKITFKDNADLVLVTWLDEWVNKTILNDEMYVTPLEDCTKVLQIAKLRPDRTVFKESFYHVIPKGTFGFHGVSDSSSEEYSVDFLIVGKK